MSKAEEYLKKNTEYNFESDECDIFHLSTIAKLMQSFADEQNTIEVDTILKLKAKLKEAEEQNKELLKRLDDKYTAYPDGWGDPLKPQDNE